MVGAAVDGSAFVPGIDESALEGGVRVALGRGDEARPELRASGSERQRGEYSPRVGDASGGDHRDRDRVDDLRHEREGGETLGADVAARFGALGHDRVDAGGDRLDSQTHGGDDVEDDGAGLLQPRRVARGRSGSCDHDTHALVEHDLDEPLDDAVVAVGTDVDEREVDRERPPGLRAQRADLRPQLLGLHPPRADDAERAGLRDRSGELVPADPGHAALDDRVTDGEQLAERDACHGARRPLSAREVPPIETAYSGSAVAAG